MASKPAKPALPPRPLYKSKPQKAPKRKTKARG
jgi:hypothetical protein